MPRPRRADVPSFLVAMAALGVVSAAVLTATTPVGQDLPRQEGTGVASTIQLASFENSTAATPSRHGRFLLTTALPSGPGTAAGYRLARPPRGSTSELAHSLGIWTAGKIVGGQLVARSGDRTLTVSRMSGHQWLFSRPAPMPCDTCGAPAPLTRASALAMAGPVLRAVGLDPRSARVSVGGSNGLVDIAPRVNGLPTTGLDTAVTIKSGRIVAARGWLTSTVRGSSYPVVSAVTALDLLAAQTTVTDRECTAPPGSCPVATVTITGARFGLSLQQVGPARIMAPSWLFTVKGSRYPLTQVAISPAHLATIALLPTPAP